MYEIAICDDDTVFSSQFEKILSKTLDAKGVIYRLSLFADIHSLQDSLEDGRKYSLIFLDILFETEKGIRFARFLQKKNYKIDIVFVTSSPDYAVSSYDVASLHYLTKPVDQAKLEVALDRFLNKNTPRSLHFSTSKGILHVKLDDILFFEIYGHKIIIHKTNGTSQTCSGTLKELESLLPALTFVRPHRSYLVNLTHISEIVRYQIRLSSGDSVPVSKNLYQQIQSSFIEYADKNSLSP